MPSATLSLVVHGWILSRRVDTVLLLLNLDSLFILILFLLNTRHQCRQIVLAVRPAVKSFSVSDEFDDDLVQPLIECICKH